MSNRLHKLRNLIEENDCNACLIAGRANTLYFSGFTGTTSLLLVSIDKAWLIVDFRYTIQAREQAYEGIEVIEIKKSFYSTLKEIVKHNSIDIIGFEGQALTVTEYNRIKEKLTKAKKLIRFDGQIDWIRSIKDSDEIEKIQQAVLLGDKVFEHIIKFIKPGMKEIEVAAELEYTMKRLGAKGPSFDSIIAAGHRSAMCHGTATENIIKNGDAVVLDFGVIYRNYCSDMTRTLFIGEPKRELIKIYDIVKKAQQAALDGITSGMIGYNADKIARDIIGENGYEETFGHSLGHGVGIEIHEEPRLSKKSEDVLRDGMVFSVEPGIYVEGLGGVRIEDMVVLEDGKIRNLTTSSKEIIIV